MDKLSLSDTGEDRKLLSEMENNFIVVFRIVILGGGSNYSLVELFSAGSLSYARQ